MGGIGKKISIHLKNDPRNSEISFKIGSRIIGTLGNKKCPTLAHAEYRIPDVVEIKSDYWTMTNQTAYFLLNLRCPNNKMKFSQISLLRTSI